MFDVDKIYMMRKTLPIQRLDRKEARSILLESFDKVWKQEIYDFINIVYKEKNIQKAYSKYPDISKVFRRTAFTVVPPTQGKLYRDNKIVDMTYNVLTHPSQTTRLLKPGGFTEQRYMGYFVTALKMGKTLEELEGKDADQLKEICYKESNLIYFKDQAQFYKQNSIAGTILGIFASERTNHAFLEGDNLSLNTELNLNIGAYKNENGKITLDPTYDTEGNFVGDTLGSLVAAAADAVKDPVLNLTNINSTTANLLITMLRIGIPFRTASLLLSSNTISNILETLGTKALTEYTTFVDEIKSSINNISEANNIGHDSLLVSENLSEEELIKDIQGKGTSEISFKILNTCLNLLSVNGIISKISKLTRLNSIVTAAGPLMSDNLIMEENFKKFPNNVISEGEVLTREMFLESHPILKQFYTAYNLPRQMMPSAVAFSPTIESLFTKLTSHGRIYEKLLSNRELLNKFLDFVLNYSMVNGDNPAIDAKDLKYFIQDFPKEFVLKEYKKKYVDNKFIQAIQIISKDKDIILKIDTTGLDEGHKEGLKNAWGELFTKDPKLARHLYMYAFFKGGIGFSPKTFMALLPNKMRIQDQKRNDILKSLPQIDVEILLDQFLGNNHDEYRLIKFVSSKNNDIKITVDENNIPRINNVNKTSISNYTYFKFNNKLFKLVGRDEVSKDKVNITLQEIPLLGNNNSYLEVSNEAINKPASLFEDTDSTGLNYTQYVSNLDVDSESVDNNSLFTSEDVAFAKAIGVLVKVNNYTTEQVEQRVKEIESTEDLKIRDVSLLKLKEKMKEAFEKEGLKFDESIIEKKRKKTC